jgi:hypothetical protein
MSDRITPYAEGGSIKERIDEIRLTGVDVHLEMLDEDAACLVLYRDGVRENRFALVAVGHKLIISQNWSEF